MSRYAVNTEVSSDKSVMEIKRILGRYGATAFMFSEDNTIHKVMVSFRVRERFYKIGFPIPDQRSREFTHTPERSKPRSQASIQEVYEQAIRQRWRALALAIKAVLEASESGIWTLERVLQSFILLPDGQTVGEWMEEQLNQAYLTGKMPAFLPLLEHKG